MPSKTKPLTGKALEAFEAERDLGAELLQSIREMKAGQGKVVYSEAIEARKKTWLSQSQFASLLGVSVRTLQGWEQGRKQPSGAALHCWLLHTNHRRLCWPWWQTANAPTPNPESD